MNCCAAACLSCSVRGATFREERDKRVADWLYAEKLARKSCDDTVVATQVCLFACAKRVAPGR